MGMILELAYTATLFKKQLFEFACNQEVKINLCTYSFQMFLLEGPFSCTSVAVFLTKNKMCVYKKERPCFPFYISLVLLKTHL